MTKIEMRLRFRDLLSSMRCDKKISNEYYYKIVRIYEKLNDEYKRKKVKK